MFEKRMRLIWLLIVLLMSLIIFFWGWQQKRIINNLSFSSGETNKWKSLQKNFKEINSIISQLVENIEDVFLQQTNTEKLLTDRQVEELKNKVLQYYEQKKEK